MDNILRGIQGNNGIFVYIDDLIICSNSIEQYETYLRTTTFILAMTRLREANLKLQLDKCEFLKKEVSYLGHILSKKDLSPYPKKLEAVRKFPIPIIFRFSRLL